MAELKVHVIEVVPTIAKMIGVSSFRKSFPNTLAALNAIAYEYMKKWREFTMGAAIPGTGRRISSRGGYTRSINADISEPSRKIIYSQADKPYTEWIERGHGEIDLKDGLLSGPKSRMGKLGRYNIVGFRHGVPDTLSSNSPMPMQVYQVIKTETDRLDAAFRKKQSEQRGASIITGQKVVDDRVVRGYAWGYRLSEAHGGPALTKKTSKGVYQWTTGKYTGMVRMDTTVRKAKYSQYMTFRVVSYKSHPASWIIPPVAGVPIRTAVVEAVAPLANILIKNAIEADLA